MMHLIFGSPLGRKVLYVCLFCCFILFTGFVYTASVPASPVPQQQVLALQGKHLWQQYNCSSCHQLYGLGGYIGPDVTNVISSKGKGEGYARAIIQSGTTTMPDFKLNGKEVDALIAFLKHADETGKSTREYFSTDELGQIHQKATPAP